MKTAGMSDEREEVYAFNPITVNGIKGIYVMTYGGGPEGGYLVVIPDELEEIEYIDYLDTTYTDYYTLHRTWGETWTMTRGTKALEFSIDDYGIWHVMEIDENPVNDCE